MLETIRDYGLERLGASDDRDAIPERHAEFFAGLARAAEPEIVGEEQARWLDRLDAEQANLRAAMAWHAGNGRIDEALLMGGWLWRFWHQRAHLSEGRETLERLLGRPESAAPLAARAAALEALGGLTYWQNDFEAADRAYGEALGIARALGDERVLAEALYNAAFVANILDRPDDARAMHEESLAIFEALGDTDGMTRVREGLVLFLIRTKDWSLAHAFEAENLHEYRELRLPFRIANATSLMSVMSACLGDVDRATRELAEAIEIFRGAGDLPSLLNCLVLGAGIAIAADDHAAAARIMGGFRAQREPLGAVATAIGILGIPDPEIVARDVLGDAAFEAELAAGGRLSMAELLDQAVRAKAGSELRA
jgi:tetratricopeptide (TPR) repeat protein